MDIVVVDGDAARRAQIRAMIECAGGSCALFETAAQFDSHPLRSLICFVADELRMLRSISIMLSRFEVRPLVLAYREAPATREIVEALRSGADDYLEWPFGPRAIRMRLQAARRSSEIRRGLPVASKLAGPGGEHTSAGHLTRGLRLVWNRAANR